MNSEQLEREQALKARRAPVAFAAALLLVAAGIIGTVGTHAKVDEETLFLIVAHKRFPLDLISSIINAGGLFGLAVVLDFLWQATSNRRPGMSAALRLLPPAGAVIAGLAGVAYEIAIAIDSHKFVTTGQQTYPEAHHFLDSTAVLALGNIPILGAFLFAVALVMISLNAMRVGLLPKVMGYIGIFVGILFIFPILGPLGAVIQASWICAVGYLYFGRWPNEYPPAWAKGEAVPWPTAQRQPRASASTPARGGRGKPRPTPAPEPVAAPTTRTRASTPKRKRKRRH